MGKNYIPGYLLLIIMVLGLTATACAEVEQMGSKFRSGEELVINEPVEGDLYLTGGDITVNSPINGDLLVVGGNIVVNGEVKGDLYAAGGRVDLNGPVGGDVAAAGGEVRLERGRIGGDARLAGGNVSVSNTVSEDLLVSAGDLSIGSNARVEGDLIFGAGNTAVSGAVSGNIVGSADKYTRSGTVRGSESVNISKPEEAEPAPTAAEMILDRVRVLAMLLLVGALILWLAPGPLNALSMRLRARPLLSMGWGLLGCAGILVGLIAFSIAWTISAVLLGLATLEGLVATVIVSGILADLIIILAFMIISAFITWIIVGYTIAKLSRPSDERPLDRFVTMGLGVLALVLISSIPVIDVVVSIAVFLAGLGVITWAIWDAIFGERPRPVEETAPQVDPYSSSASNS